MHINKVFMIKTSYFLLHQEVNKLFEKKFKSSDKDGINAHIDFIHAFIEANGYTTDEYLELLMNEGQSQNLN